jgi:hypothetical protein
MKYDLDSSLSDLTNKYRLDIDIYSFDPDLAVRSGDRSIKYISNWQLELVRNHGNLNNGYPRVEYRKCPREKQYKFVLITIGMVILCIDCIKEILTPKNRLEFILLYKTRLDSYLLNLRYETAKFLNKHTWKLISNKKSGKISKNEIRPRFSSLKSS